MSFYKKGTPEEILEVIAPQDDKDAKKKLKQARQQAKNIDKDGNNNELSKNTIDNN